MSTSCFDRSGRIDHDRLSKNSREKEDQTAKAAVEELIQNCDTARENLIEFRRNQLSYFVKNWRKKFKKETNHVVSHTDPNDIRVSTISSVKSFRRMRNG
ncbi:hypothetical protein [Leptospira santarosai]|uniref:hypothetical protein n=1 Tax=Leptospira santarosai TaxID=28183 RepID=UPI0002C00F65|nr:hypothetical protein [Leptospira santarosai]EMO70108.1 hypothetical protein LEP1GSC130_3249 [Leptospira santarosai str. 200403458]EMO97785.1 hypothetical protein LEP1GSC120_4011 [Leptospira santarosai str. 200702252]